MTKLRTGLGDGSAGGPFRRSEPARKGERDAGRTKARGARHRKARRALLTRWPDKARSCTGKMRRTQGEAEATAYALGKKEGTTMSAYPCPWCLSWHIGHDRSGR